MIPPRADHIPEPVTKTEGFNYRTLVSRLIVIILLVFSFVLLWWSYYRVFFPLLKQARELDATVAKLTLDVDEMDHRWSKEQVVQINRQFATVQTNLFPTQAALETWLAALPQQILPDGVNFKSDIKKSALPAVAQTNFTAIPASISLTFPLGPSNSTTNSPYQHLLQFAQGLSTQENAGYLNGLTVESGPHSIERAVFNFNFWTGAKEPK